MLWQKLLSIYNCFYIKLKNQKQNNDRNLGYNRWHVSWKIIKSTWDLPDSSLPMEVLFCWIVHGLQVLLDKVEKVKLQLSRAYYLLLVKKFFRIISFRKLFFLGNCRLGKCFLEGAFRKNPMSYIHIYIYIYIYISHYIKIIMDTVKHSL